MGKFLCIILSLQLFSCSRQKSDQELVLIKDAYKRLVFQNETMMTGLMGEFAAGGMSPLDSMVKADLEKIVSWRRNFVREPTTENLLLFSDSIEYAYNKRAQWSYDFSAPVSELREQIKSSPDSVVFYSLLYYAASGEGMLLQLKAVERGTVDYATWKVSSYLDKDRYQIGDTVFFTVSTVGFYYGDAAFDFSQVTCRNMESGVNIKPSMIKSGPIYILMYIPDAYGKYEIEGGFGIKREDNFGYVLRIRNSFEVSPTIPDRS